MKYLFLFTASLLFLGCAAPKLISSWKSPEADDKQVYKDKMVSMTKKEEMRKLSEISTCTTEEIWNIVVIFHAICSFMS